MLSVCLLGALEPSRDALFEVLAVGLLFLIAGEKVVKIFRRKPSLDQVLAEHEVKIAEVEKDVLDLRKDVDVKFEQQRLSIGKVHARLDTMLETLSEISATLKLTVPKQQVLEDRLNRHIEKGAKG